MNALIPSATAIVDSGVGIPAPARARDRPGPQRRERQVVVLRYGPFPRLWRALMVFGYFAVYEYCVISRSYAVGVFLMSVVSGMIFHLVPHMLCMFIHNYLVSN